MIVTIFFIAIILLCGLIGYQLKFFKSALFTFNTALALYAGLWLMPFYSLITGSLPQEIQQFADAGCCAAVFCAVIIVLSIIETLVAKQLPQLAATFEMNDLPMLDNLSGMISGLISGYMLAGFTFTMLALLPAATGFLGTHAETFARRGFTTVVVASRSIDTMNSNQNQLALKRYQYLVDVKRKTESLAAENNPAAAPTAPEASAAPAKPTTDAAVFDFN